VRVPFNRPYATGDEFRYIQEAIESGNLSGDGTFTRRCQEWLVRETGAGKALLTHSCTAALEMCALLLEVGPGDEVIMPSFTFVSTANAFALRGATPVFVDVRPDTLNLDEGLLEEAVTPRTKAICVVHYAGVACAMDEILAVAAKHGLAVVEDDAQGSMARYRGRSLGGIGTLGAISFHETKNLISGEGGALLVNDPRYAVRAETIWQKGTNRSQFARGEVEKYSWVDLGSSFLPSEMTAAFLWAQLDRAAEITARRLEIWNHYHRAFAEAERRGQIRRPIVPPECTHNGHLYYLLAPTIEGRMRLLAALKQSGVDALFHYVPLHSSPAGRRYGRVHGSMRVTDSISERLVRLPVWLGLGEAEVDRIIDTVVEATR